MKSYLERFFTILEDGDGGGAMMSGSGGVFGDFGGHGGDLGNSDWYATGDARNLFGWGGGVVQRRRKKRKKSRKRKSKR